MATKAEKLDKMNAALDAYPVGPDGKRLQGGFPIRQLIFHALAASGQANAVGLGLLINQELTTEIYSADRTMITTAVKTSMMPPEIKAQCLAALA